MAEVQNVIKTLNSGEKRRQDAKNKMAIHCNYGNLLHCGPDSITVLGLLMALSTKKDFSLKRNSPDEKFLYAKHPTSFRASLVQISDDGCNAFTMAHKNMDKIYLYSLQFQQNCKRLVPILLNGSDSDKRDVAPIFLKAMSKDAHTCLSLVEDIESSFNNLTLLLQEVSQHACKVQGVYEDEVEKCKKQKEILDRREKQIQEEKSKKNQQSEEIQKKISDAKEKLDKEFESLPGIGKTILLSVCDFFRNMTSPIAIIHEHRFKREDQEGMNIAFESAGEIFVLVKSIRNKVEQNEDKNTESKEMQEDESNDKTYIIERLSKIRDKLEQTTFCNVKPVVVGRELCNRGILICEILMKRSMIPSEELHKLKQELDKLCKDAEQFSIKADNFLSPGSLSDSVFDDTQSGTSHQPMTALHWENEKAMKKIKIKEKEYERMRKQEEENRREMEELERRNAKIMEDLCKTNIKEIDFNTILSIMSEGIQHLSNLKEQWSKLVMFFSQMTNLIKICLHPETQQLQEIAAQKSSSREIHLLILNMAANINAVSVAAGETAKAYTDISGKHLIGNLAGLSRMVAFDPEKDQKQLEESKNELISKCNEAKEEISKLVKERHYQTLRDIDEIYDQLGTLEKLVPMDEDRKRKIGEYITESVSDFIQE